MAKKNKVLVGLSGGIDSTITSYLLKKQGYEVVGVHFKFYDTDSNHNLVDIQKIANQLDIALIHHDAKELFQKEIIDFYTSMHLQGLTPSPCAHCNPNVKWKLLIDLANIHNCEYVSTGHYINIENQQTPPRVFKAKDEKKDQSYYLWNMPESILTKAITPLGNFYKEDIFKLASEIDFGHLVKKSESAGLCFAKGKNCEDILNAFIPGQVAGIGPGDVLDKNNAIVGRHKGYVYYTIGQKKDLELNIPEKLCVSKIDSFRNTLWVDTWQNLYKNEFDICSPHFITRDDITQMTGVSTKVRGFGLNPEGFSKVIKLSENRYRVVLENPAWAPAPGQPAVFYKNNELLGGGIIDVVL